MNDFKSNSFRFTHDGEPTDKRLHVEDMVSFAVGEDEDFSEGEREYLQHRDGGRLKTEKEYNEFYGFTDSIAEEREDFTVYLWEDVSGYDYWKGDYNYLQNTISFDEKYTVEEFFEKFQDEIDNVIIDMNQKVYDKFGVTIYND